MDWNEIVEASCERIIAAIAPLLAVLGFDPRRQGEMPRHFHRAFLLLLRPAESAARRLIVMAARGIIVTLRLGVSRAFPAGLGQKLKLALEKGTEHERIPAFQLIDPLKRFSPEGFGWAEEWGKDWGKVPSFPRISVPGFSDPVFAEPVPFPSHDDIVDTSSLVGRIRALKSALEDLPRQALRLARWKARGELARKAEKWKPGRLSPFRPGFAPGYHRSDKREIDNIISDMHYFASEAWRKWERPDTS